MRMVLFVFSLMLALVAGCQAPDVQSLYCSLPAAYQAVALDMLHTQACPPPAAGDQESPPTAAGRLVLTAYCAVPEAERWLIRAQIHQRACSQ